MSLRADENGVGAVIRAITTPTPWSTGRDRSVPRRRGLLQTRRDEIHDGRVGERRRVPDRAVLRDVAQEVLGRGAELVAWHITNLKKGALSAAPGRA